MKVTFRGLAMLYCLFCLILAGLGVMEFATGHAGPGILTAVAFEISCVIALALVVGVRSSRINVDQTVA